MSSPAVARLSLEEYFALDDSSDFRWEFHDGEVFRLDDMTGWHGIIQASISSCLVISLRGTPCVVSGPARVRVTPRQYLCPDVMVVCGVLTAAADRQAIVSPKVVIEILSPRTGDYDSGTKYRLYKLLPSLVEYVLVAQDEPRIEVFRRAGNDEWSELTYRGLNAVARLQSLNVDLPLAQIYANVEFPPAEEL